MRVLVTGSTGFIGRLLIPKLLANPITTPPEPVEGPFPEPVEGEPVEAAEAVEVTLLLREQHNGRSLPPPLNQLRSHYNVVYADLRNFNLTVRAVRQAEPDAVIHLAAAGVTDPFLSIETAVRHNLTGTTNLLRACFEKSGSVEQCIIARTPGEQSSMNIYAASKAAAWEFCRFYARTQDWPIYGAMIFQAYGTGQPDHAFIPAAFRAAAAGQDFPMTDGTQIRDWITGEDVAAGLGEMLNRPLSPGNTVELGTGQGTSLAEVAALIYQTVNRGGRLLPGRLPNRPGEEPVQIANATQTQALTGWRAQTTLAEGLANLFQE